MDSDFIKGMNKCLDAYNGVIGNIYVYSHHTEMTDKLDELAETLAQGGGPGPGPTPPSSYDYYIENVNLANNNYIDTQISIFSSENVNRDWQIDFKMHTSASSGERPYIGTSQRSGKTLELYLDNSGTYLWMESSGFPDYLPLASSIEDKDVTITMINNVITIKADGDIVIQHIVTGQTTGSNTLLIGKYVGGNSYYYKGYCDYFGFKWLT